MTTEQSAEARERWVAANIERSELREQAWRNHKDNLDAEERRYQAELDHIDRVYEMRTEASPDAR